MKNKKPVPMTEGLVPIKPVSKAEHRRLSKLIESRHRKLRKKYPEVHNKRVDWIVLLARGRPILLHCPLHGWKRVRHDLLRRRGYHRRGFLGHEHGDEVILREYYRRRED
jgi:hypothetical protein